MNTMEQLEKLFKEVADRPNRKFDDSITRFDRDIFYYNRDEISRQSESLQNKTRVTYENHRKAVETAIVMFKKYIAHDIAMCILTNRFFAPYRDSVFSGEGSFNTDYAFIIRKADAIINNSGAKKTTVSIANRLAEFKTPTLVQVNHLAGIVKTVTVPNTGETLNEWAIKFNHAAPESTSYKIAGLQVRV